MWKKTSNSFWFKWGGELPEICKNWQCFRYYPLKNNQHFLMPAPSTWKEICDRVANTNNNKFMYNQWQPKPKKFLKECDCCGKESGPTAQCSALAALKGQGARAALLQAWWAQTSKKVNSAYCTDHRSVQGSHIASATNQLCFTKPSARICVYHSCFPLSSCKQGVVSLPCVQLKIAGPDLVSSLRAKVTASKQQFQGTPGSHREKPLWNDRVRVPFPKRMPWIPTHNGRACLFPEIGVGAPSVNNCFVFCFFNRLAQQIHS